jgi:pyruvate/2-oxoglutarate dehydrogenase complex dihydrolipoamide dehydrogenase (E3) component
MTARHSSPVPYDFVVLGGGSGGLTAARFAARLDRCVAIVEASQLGGDCTWTGCVPSKALVRSANVAQAARSARDYGIEINLLRVDWPLIKTRINSVIEEIYSTETPDALQEEGIDTLFAPAEFLDPHTIQVGDSIIQGKRFLICTGARPSIPKIPGLRQVGYLTYETVWDIDLLPERLLIIGGGPIGCELAQAFARLGVRVTLVEATHRVLGQDEPEVSELIARTLVSEGVELALHQTAESVRISDQQIIVTSGIHEWKGDSLLVATGRVPNVDGLNLESAGVTHSRHGVVVDRFLRTSQRHIYAAGDCTGGPQFTHYAGWQGFMAARNAPLPGNSSGVKEAVPWGVFTDPEIAHAGLTEAGARLQYGDTVRVINWPLKGADRAVIDGANEGFIKAVTLGNGRLLGASIAAPRAGEMIHEWALAIERRMKLADLASTIHSYPTYSMSAMQMAAEEGITRLLTGFSGKAVRTLSRFTR